MAGDRRFQEGWADFNGKGRTLVLVIQSAARKVQRKGTLHAATAPTPGAGRSAGGSPERTSNLPGIRLRHDKKAGPSRARVAGRF
jgi:hypothetical protein